MNSFGLGLVLNFVDNATAGMGNATRAFQQMSQTADAVSSSVSTSITDIVTASYALDQVGTTLMNAGSSIISLYGNVSQSVIDAGSEMQSYRMTLSALYGDIDAGNAKLEEIKDYAAHSVFEIQSLIPAVTTMKAVGIEAMNEITTSSGQNTQKLLDYASDLAAMMPNMRNAYGTGVSAAMGAFKEYIAEGNAMSLKRGAGLDITGLLGEDKGATIEERTQQIADLIETLNIAGFTKNLEGTPTQRLSNMQDQLFNTLTRIADSGVFEKYCSLLETLSDWLESLVEDEETFNIITGVLADTVTSLLEPIESLLDLLIENGDALINWIKENPKLTKNILLTVAAVGAFLVAGGAFLKIVSSVGMASSGFSFLKNLPSILGTVGSGFGKLVIKATPFLALAGLLYYAWTENLFGIRDVITETFSYLGDVFTVLKDAWGDNTLSGENYDLAESMGILPLIEAILQAKYYWDFFADGFKTGFDEFFKSIEEFVGIFGIDLSDVFTKIGEFLKSLFDIGQEDKWKNIGEVAGKIGGIVVSVLALVKVLSFLKPLLGLFGGKKGGLFGGKGAGGTSALSTMKDFGVMLLGLSAVLVTVGLISMIPFSIPRVIQLIAVIGILGIIGTVLSLFARIIGGLSVAKVALGLANLAIVLIGLSGVLAVVGLVSMMPIDIARVTQLIVIIGVMGVLGTALVILSALLGLIPIDKVLTGVANIALVMIGLSATLAVMDMLTSKTDASSILAIIAVVTVLGVLGSVLTGLAALIGLIPFPVVLAGIANIALVVGALTGLAVLVSEALPTIGENMNKFITSLEPAFEVFQMLQGLDMAGIGAFFDSFGSFMLKVTGDKFASFFTGGSDLTNAAEQLVDFATVSKEAFDLFAQIDIASFNNLMGAIDAISTIGSKNIPSTYEGMYSSINTSVNNSLVLLNTFAVKGFNVGSNLMNSIARGITARTWVVKNALQSALSGLNVTASPSVTLNMTPTVSTSEMVGLATGGYVKETGVAVLHPDEVVVNDDTTRKLNEFLSQQSVRASGSSSFNSSKGEAHNDYSVTFSAGSVVIQLSNASDTELEKAADKLMKIIERKQQLKAMAVRS